MPHGRSSAQVTFLISMEAARLQADQAERQPKVMNVHTSVGEERGCAMSASVCHVKAAWEQKFAPSKNHLGHALAWPARLLPNAS